MSVVSEFTLHLIADLAPPKIMRRMSQWQKETRKKFIDRPAVHEHVSHAKCIYYEVLEK